MEHPVTGFHVASVHSIALRSAITDQFETGSTSPHTNTCSHRRRMGARRSIEHRAIFSRHPEPEAVRRARSGGACANALRLVAEFPRSGFEPTCLCQRFRRAAVLNALALLGTLRAGFSGVSVASNPPRRKTMATRAHQHSRRARRLRRVRNAVRGQWLLALIARTLSTVLLMVVSRWLHLPMPGGE